MTGPRPGSRAYRAKLEAVYGLAEDLSRASSLEEIYEKTLACAERCLRVDRTALLLLDESGVMRFKAWRGLSPAYRSAVEGHLPWPRGSRRPRPVLVPDAGKDASLGDLREAIRSEGIAALAFIPLVCRGRLTGKFALYYEKPHRFPEQDVLLAQAIANHVAFAVERMQAEAQLRESEERYLRLIEISPEPIAIHVEGKLAYVNPAAARLVGADSPAELTGRSIFDFVPPEFMELVTQRMRQVQERGLMADLVEEKLLTLHGETLDVELVGIPITFEGQKASQVFIRDATERKRADRALREAEENYRGMFENAPIGIFQTTPEGRFISANEALARMLGYSSAAEFCKAVQDIGRQVHVDPARRAEFARLLEQNETVSGFESQAYRKDGRVIWISLTGRSVRDSAGNVLHYEGLVEDVTPRKQAERRLAGQYQVTRLLAEARSVEKAIPGVLRAICETLDWDMGQFWSVDRDSGQMHCLATFARPQVDVSELSEASRKEGMPKGLGVPGRVWQSGEPTWVTEISKDAGLPRGTVAAREGLRSAFAFPIVLGGETRGVMEFFSLRQREPDEELMAAMTATGRQVGQFIEHLRAQEAVLTRERQQAFVARLGSEAIKGTDVQALMEQAVELLSQALDVEYAKVLELLPDGKKLRLRAGTGWSPGLVGKAIVPADRDSQGGWALELGTPVIVRDWQKEERFRGSGLLVDHGVVSGMSVIIQGREGPFGVLGVHTKRLRSFTEDDVNFVLSVANVLAEAIERARSEESVRESRARITAILNTAVDAIITIDERGIIQSFNPAASQVFGYSAEETIGQKVNMLMSSPEREEHDRYLENYLRTGEKKIIGIGREVTGRRKDGTTFPMELAISEVGLADERLFTGIVRDITERRRSEEVRDRLLSEIEAQRRRVQNLVADVPGVVWEAYGEPDEAGQRIDFVSRHVEDILGYSVEEWLSTPNFWLKIVADEDRERAAQEAADIFAGKREGVSEFRWLRKDGRAVWVEAKSTVIRDEHGSPIGMRGVTMEITERKLAEERQRLLAEAGSRLSSSKDYRSTMAEVARLAVARVADLCVIDLVEEDAVRRAALAHRDRDAGARLSARERVHSLEETEHACVRVAASMQSEFYPTLAELAAGAAGDSGHLGLLREFDLLSAIVAPVHAGKQPLGAITLAATGRSRSYTETDLAFAEELGRRIGIAIDNARRYEAEQEARAAAERATKNLSRLQKLTEAALSHLSLTELLREMMTRVHELLRVDSTVVFLVEERDGTLIARSAVGVEEGAVEGLVVPVGTGFAGEIAAREAGRIANDLSEAGIVGPVLGEPRMRAMMGAPMLLEGRVVGVLQVAALRERQFVEEELSLLQLVADRVALAVDHVRLFEAEQRARRLAEDAAVRMARLQAVTSELSEALTAAEVAQCVIDAALNTLHAHSGVILRLEEDPLRLEVIAARGETSDFTDDWQRFVRRPPGRLIEALHGGQPIFAPSTEELLAAFPEPAALPVAPVRGFACIPLTVEGKAIGAMALTFEKDRTLEEEKEFILSLAGQCAQALERSRLYEAERDARRAAESAAVRTARLQAATAALSEAVTPTDVANIIVEQVMTAMDAMAGAVALRGNNQGEIEIAAQEGYPAALVEEWRRLPLDWPEPMPLLQAIEQNRGIFLESTEAIARDYPRLRAAAGIGGAWATIPLALKDRAAGGLSLSFAAPRTFSEEDRAYLLALGRLGAQALERARLYEDEQRARAEAEAAEQRQAFLAKASDILSSSLDYETTLASLARLCVPYLGDWCAIDVVEDDGRITRVAVVHSDPEKVQLARELQERYPPKPHQATGVARAIRSGEPDFHPEISDELLQSWVPAPELLGILRGLGLKSSMSVPLQARDRTLGVLTLVTAESGRRYADEDLEFARDLAGRAALAVDNARLYRESQRILEELRVANEAKDEFLGMVSHELRTPITTIYGGSRFLSSHGPRFDDESKADILKDIEQESERLHRIVEDLLVLARMEMGQQLVTEPVLVQRVIEKAVAVLTKRRPMRKVYVHCDKVLEAANASPGALEQILRNLLNNADKYSPVSEAIDVAATERDRAIVITVADRGPGIPADEAELIFERFYRSGQTAKQAGGAGIGLTVCKRLVEAQSGRIWARPREGGGTEVSFSLPVYRDGRG